jgi:acyl transferase domain-containing protein/pimeloyl-ACP methyl ester carboxylesterase/acyl carrier protein
MSIQYNTEQEIKKILEMVKLRHISPQEGHEKIQRLKSENRNKFHDQRETVGNGIFVIKGLTNDSYQQPAVKDIAVIGMSGRFPGANNVEELWKNLTEGKSSITEVPKERWDIDAYFDPDVKKLAKTNSRWGGFLEDIDKFDPLFFNISGMEAEVTDPQQRLFLEECWKSLEDAGYANDNISNKKCGVYVGVGPSDYLIRMIEEQVQGGGQAYWGNSGSVLASRISYFLNLKGPAITVDTACSSSLVAMHLACQGIIAGEIDMAIAGGVVVCTAPYYFVATSNAGMLSPDGMCKSFDNGANGIVNGEAVGAVILKPLDQAIKDGDNIYGVIKSSGINQDGKTNGITAPSTLSQTELELEVYRKGNINPETINYIEAHGTGTKLGDPIEIEALTNSFKKFTNKKQFCAIGSLKTNIGHTAPAAGVASVIKVLLALKYKKIPPSLNFKQENEHIGFKDTPFYVNTKLQNWSPNQDGIRRAGVSSFGFSGTNAHLVIEEAPRIERRHSEMPGYLIVLSARSTEQLKQQAEQLVRYCETVPQVDCGDMSYTLLLGRKHFNHRLACIVRTQQELVALLRNWLEKGDTSQIHLAKLSDNNLREQTSRKQYGNQCIEECQNLSQPRDYLERLAVIADLYVQGYRLGFEKLFANQSYSRISLPTYPFARERYWAFEADSAGGTAATRSIGSHLHPLVHQNTSDLFQQRFSSTFTSQEFFITDNIETGQRELPGVAYLEMARAAMEQAVGRMEEGSSRIQLKEVVWEEPVTVGEQPVKVHIGLFPRDSQGVEFEIIRESEEDNFEPLVLCNGVAELNSIDKIPTLDLKALQTEYAENSLNSTQCYESLRAMGIDYTSKQQGIETVYVGQGQVLAKLSMPSFVSKTANQLALHPGLLDSALQAAMCLISCSDDQKLSNSKVFHKSVHPFTLQELNLFSKCSLPTWALIRFSDKALGTREWEFDIDLCDAQGKICVQIKGFSLRVSESEVFGTLLLQPDWKEQGIGSPDVPDNPLSTVYSQQLVILCELGQVSQDRMAAQMKEIAQAHRSLVWQSKENSIDKRFQTYAEQAFTEIQNILKEKPTGKVLLQIVVSSQDEQQLFSGLSGLLKTARLENSKLIGQLIEVEPEEHGDGIIEKLQQNSQSPSDNWIRYRDDKRWVPSLTTLEVSQQAIDIPWRDNGIYLITGGVGGLGLIFAREIASKCKNPTLILIGRSSLDNDKQAQLQELQAVGARIEYRQVDITQKEDVCKLIQSILADFSSLNGIIHGAGVIRDNFILKKTREELQGVLGPKVGGLVNLDEASKDLSLDFLILFSSVAGIAGNPGQADYATANTFMDAYAKYRNALVASKQRQGRTLSINWPLWKDGGMHVDEATEKTMLGKAGTIPLRTSSGIRAFYQSLASGREQVLVMEGKSAQMKQSLLSMVTQASAPHKRDSGTALEINNVSMLAKVQGDLAQITSNILKVKIQNIDGDAELSTFGFDSLTLTEFVNKVNQKYQVELNPTIFFEYPTLHSFGAYLVKEYQDVIGTQFIVQTKAEIPVQTPVDEAKVFELEKNKANRRHSPRFVSTPAIAGTKSERTTFEPIAIIGMSGIFPMARDLNQFWENLVEGKDCISEIPKDRWDWREYYGDPKTEKNKTNIKLGGFIDGVDEFDPLFFGISPREAELMDPQQRLLMTYIWKAIEDAGYAAKSLAGTRTGIFVGIADSGYGLLLSKTDTAIESYFSTSMVQSMGPNRMSYFLNIHGPSEPVETACSSALVAINRAASAMENGTCEMAIVGGINTILIPEIHISMSKAGALSIDGRCKTFSNEANGYVRGEGVGMLVLKKLKAAEEAGDHIYGIIRSASENHGGRANSLTAPNPKAQAELLVNAYTRSGIDPRTVTYIEAHGTGTELGDPVEINGLKTAFKELYQATGDPRVAVAHCGLGSVKTNIGHLEIAAGIAGVMKVLLQLKHKTLVKSLHCDVINPYIQLQGSPFYIVQETKEWQALKDAAGKELPRRAGVSSFGFGGANAHIVLEEYIENEGNNQDEEPQIIVLSAKNKDRLKEYASDFLAFLHGTEFMAEQTEEKILTRIQNELLRISSEILQIDVIYLNIQDDLKDYGLDKLKLIDLANGINAKFNLQIESNLFHEYFTLEAISKYLYLNQGAALLDHCLDSLDDNVSRGKALSLRDVAYTLQVGREAMDERLAMVVQNIEEIKEKLQDFLNGQANNLVFSENIRKIKAKFQVFNQDEDANEMITHWVNKKKLSKIAELWANGYELNWNLLHHNFPCRRIALPTYPFAKEKYWAPSSSPFLSFARKKEMGTLIDSLEFELSLDSGITFTKQLNKSLLIVKDHNILGLNIFPGVGYLEMAYQAAAVIKGHTNFHISRVFWMQPLVVEEDMQVLITFKKENEKLLFDVHSRQNGNPVIHAKGEIQDALDNASNPTFISIEEIKLRCNDNVKGDKIYQSFESKGMNYGPFFQGTVEVFGNQDEVLGVLNLPNNDDFGLNYYSLHPTLLDSALQIIGCIKKFGKRPPLPFAVERVEVLHPLKSKVYAYARIAGTSSFNVALIDEDGRVCIKFLNVVLKEAKDKYEDLYYRPVWEKSPILPQDQLVQNRTEEQKTTLIIYPEDGLEIAEIIARRHENRVYKLRLGTLNTKDTGNNSWEINTNDRNALDNYISDLRDVDTIYFLGGILLHPVDLHNLDGLHEAQERGVMTLFRLIKTLEKHHLLQQTIKLKIITNNVYKIDKEVNVLPSAASIHGFIKSLSKEYPKLNITSIDIDLIKASDSLSAPETVHKVVEPIFTEPFNRNGETITYRTGERYELVIQPIRLAPADKTMFRENGVYVIVGGAGGIGIQLSRYLAKSIHARLVLIGRSELDNDKKDRLRQIEALGGVVLYCQGDVTNLESMAEAIKEAKFRFGEINGVFHSAIVSLDKTIRNMDEDTLRASLAPKVTGSTVLHSVFENENLDFMAFFSSTSAIVGMPGQSNYVSGLNYKDAFAKYIGQKQSYPVKIFNWGYWDIGAAASADYGRRMVSQGIFPINSDEGMEAVERVLSNNEDQVIVLKADKGVLEKLGVSQKDEVNQVMDDVFEDGRQDFLINLDQQRSVSSTVGNNLAEVIGDYLKSIIAKMLKMDQRNIDNQTSLEEYGVDSLVGLKLHTNLEKSFGELPPALLLENNTVDALTEYLRKNHQDKLGMIINTTKAELDAVSLVDTNALQDKDVYHTANIAIEEQHTELKKDHFEFPVQLTSCLVETDSGAKIEVVMKGSGPPLLLIPGFAVTTSLMIYQIWDWSANYQVIAINLPGHGRSDGIDDLSLMGISTMIMNLVDKLGIDQPMHVVGGSFGGMIAQNIAKEFPERVISLSLLSSFTVSKFEGVSQFFSFAEAARQDFEIVRTNSQSQDVKDNIDRCLNIFLNSQATNQWVMVRYLDYMKLGISTLELLPEIKAPTLVVVGAVDTVVNPEESKVIHAKISNSQYFEIPDGGHFINLTHYQTINELVGNFLKNYENGGVGK